MKSHHDSKKIFYLDVAISYSGPVRLIQSIAQRGMAVEPEVSFDLANRVPMFRMRVLTYLST